jgi:cyanate permease
VENQDQRKQENKNELLLRHNKSLQQAKGDSMEVEDKTAVTVSRQAWLTLAILSSTLLTVFFSETMLLPAIPEITQDFNIPYGTAAWIFSAYLIVAAVMTPVAGRLSDLYGKKKVLLILLTIYIAGLTAGGFADNISFLLATRLIQGIGLAAVPAAFSLLRDTFPPAKLAIAVGVFGSAYSAGSVVGLLVGASIIQNFGWHATFLAIVPFSALVTFMIAKFVKKQPRAGSIHCCKGGPRKYFEQQKAVFIIIFHRHQRNTSTFCYYNFISNSTDTYTDGHKLRQSAADRSCIHSISNLIVCLCYPREKDRTTISRFEIAKTQDPSAIVHLADSHWDYYVHDISNRSTVGEEPYTTRIWRRFSRCCKRSAAFHDNVPSICKYHSIYHK